MKNAYSSKKYNSGNIPPVTFFKYKISDVGYNVRVMQESNSGTINIFFHGFNAVSNKKDILNFQDYLCKFKDATNIFIHWDSGISVTKFFHYKENADKIAFNFDVLLGNILAKRNFSKINLIGHSLGARIIFNGLLWLDGILKYPIYKIILMGGAVEWNESVLDALVKNNLILFNFFSKSDEALFLKKIDLEGCIGLSPIRCNQDIVYNIDCLSMGHCKYWPSSKYLFDFIGLTDNNVFNKLPKGEIIMLDKKISLQKRMQSIKSFYTNIDDVLSYFGGTIPDAILKNIKETILNDVELKRFIGELDKQRPPKILLMGRTGVGKSSLINALFGKYVAGISDVKSHTKGVNIYNCLDSDNNVKMKVMDTRGISESQQLSGQTAESQLEQEVFNFVPDLALLVVPANARDNIDDDIDFLKNIQKIYEEKNKLSLPVIAVVNKVDAVAPARLILPKEYSANKLENIRKILDNYEYLFEQKQLSMRAVLEVSSLIDWKDYNGSEVCAEDIEKMTSFDVQTLQIAFDGRYHIDELLRVMESSIQDNSARQGLMLALRLDEFVHKLSDKIVNVFSGISGTVAVSPIPFSDLAILLPVQLMMVNCIALLSGRDVNLDTAKEFVASLGGVVAAGMTFRLVAQQASKFLNTVFPTAGSVVSSAVAVSGTKALGKIAMAYYLDDEDLEEAKKKYDNKP